MICKFIVKDSDLVFSMHTPGCTRTQDVVQFEGYLYKVTQIRREGGKCVATVIKHKKVGKDTRR